MKKSQEQVIDALIGNLKFELETQRRLLKDKESLVRYLERELKHLMKRKKLVSKL